MGFLADVQGAVVGLDTAPQFVPITMYAPRMRSSWQRPFMLVQHFS